MWIMKDIYIQEHSLQCYVYQVNISKGNFPVTLWFFFCIKKHDLMTEKHQEFDSDECHPLLEEGMNE